MAWWLLSLLACSPDPGPDSSADTGDDCVSGALSDHQGITMSYLCPGRFTMGSPSDEVGHREDERQHRVRLTRGFYLGVHEITRYQFEELMGYTPQTMDRIGDQDAVAFWVSGGDAEATANALSDRAGLPLCYDCVIKHATYNVCALSPEWETLYDCPGYRLPTEAEWEYAARAGSTGAFSTGGNLRPGTEYDCDGKLRLDDGSWLDHIAVYCSIAEPEDSPSSSERYRQPATKEPSAWGLYDMHGNLWEWTADTYVAYPEDELRVDPWEQPADPEFYGRILRGGSWWNTPSRQRAAFRLWDSMFIRTELYGFRLARSE